MKTTKHLYSFLVLMVFALLFFSSTNVKQLTTTEKSYLQIPKKESENYNVSYILPTISPRQDTKQSQVKGGISVTCELIPFSVTMKDKVEKIITYADPGQPGFDVYEISHTPVPEVTPNKIKFNIKIKNNQERILKIRETALLLMVDGIQYHIPEESLKDWYAGMIIKEGVFNYEISGPEINSLNNAKLVYLFINDVPTIMDEGGNIKKRENFEWYFECKSEEVKKADKKTYSYETSPIYKEKCQKCSGTGTDPQPITCTSCSGKGTRVNKYDNKTYQCSTCKGTGKVYNKCGTCYGVGIVSYPKSVKPPVISSITWNGAVVEVVTNPPGAKISVVNTKTQEYQSVGMSNLKVDWYSSSEKSYPIIIEYQGQTSKVLPYNASGKLIPKVVINFISGSPNVTAGQRVN